ncbi:MAG: hypothetical protein Q8P20_02965 [bacterium]|nr:hypothetical protein [bacterium]
MSIVKKVKDNLIKYLLGKASVPRGLFELNQYFRHYNDIDFDYKKSEDGTIVAISQNFRYGSIVTSGKNLEELDRNIKDAILTSFDIPSSYASDAQVHKVGDCKQKYALA